MTPNCRHDWEGCGRRTHRRPASDTPALGEPQPRTSAFGQDRRPWGGGLSTASALDSLDSRLGNWSARPTWTAHAARRARSGQLPRGQRRAVSPGSASTTWSTAAAYLRRRCFRADRTASFPTSSRCSGASLSDFRSSVRWMSSNGLAVSSSGGRSSAGDACAAGVHPAASGWSLCSGFCASGCLRSSGCRSGLCAGNGVSW